MEFGRLGVAGLNAVKLATMELRFEAEPVTGRSSVETRVLDMTVK